MFMKHSIHDESALKWFFKENKIQPFRYKQVEHAIYKDHIVKFEEMTTISKDLRVLLEDNFFYSEITIDKTQQSENKQITKLLFKTHDWLFFESVIMRHLTGRITLCVSSQVWCAMGCTFCATGTLWIKRNLTTYEIIDQVMFAENLLQDENETLRNVVFMWMGEPMLNYDNVKEAILIITAQTKINISNRRVTISTCWIIPGIELFMEDFSQVSLALSLHAPNDTVRSKIMKINKKYPLSKLMPVLDKYVAKTNKRIFYEYVMIDWINDWIKLADELWELLEWKLAHVNFIPYNPWEWVLKNNYTATSRTTIIKFQKILEKYWIPSTIRTTLWDDISAACGQLAKSGEKPEE